MPNHLSEGLVLRHWECEELGVDLECWFVYEAEERGSREAGTGLQLEPDYPETWTLCHVYLPGSNLDIAAVMSPRVVEAIEEDAVRDGDGWRMWEFDDNLEGK